MEQRPRFFSSPDKLRAWFEKNHDKKSEQWIGFYRKSTGKPTITWSESVDQALCFGWIDGKRKKIDDTSYMIRFTPRNPYSGWSAINLAKVKDLKKKGLMHPNGLAVYEKRPKVDPGIYSYERLREARFSKQQLARFRKETAAWEFFSAQPPGYRATATHWVVSAKRDETQERRLTRLIEDSAAGKRLSTLG
jgi:uncharacterized protein YdeI (YjbR/CyaY-like superfamily)